MPLCQAGMPSFSKPSMVPTAKCHFGCNDKDDDGASATSFHKIFLRSALLMGPFEEQFLSFGNSIFNGHFGVLGEVLVSDNQLVQLVSQKVCAC